MPLQTNFSEHKFFARTRALTVAVPGRRRDWFRILRDLMTVGISMSAVGRLCNRDVGTVRAWAQGGEPKESDARLVLALYSQHCPDQYRKSQSVFEIHTSSRLGNETDSDEELAADVFSAAQEGQAVDQYQQLDDGYVAVKSE